MPMTIDLAFSQAPDGTGAVLDPNTGLGAWSVVEPSETYLVQGDIDQPRWGKRPRGFGKGDSDEDEVRWNWVPRGAHTRLVPTVHLLACDAPHSPASTVSARPPHAVSSMQAQDKLRLLKTSNPIPEEMKEAVARCAAKAEADEAASEPVVFKKRKATTSGFRRKL